MRLRNDPDLVDALAGVEAIDPNVPATVAEVLGAQGPTFTIGGACASGNLAIREGYRDILLGEVDRAVVTGALFDVSPPDIQASVVINAVVVKPEYQNRPEEASRPFDIDRCGFVYSHGAGTLILESLESALERGATIYGEVLGVKASANANHLPLPGAEKQTRLMISLLRTREWRLKRWTMPTATQRVRRRGICRRFAPSKGHLESMRTT